MDQRLTFFFILLHSSQLCQIPKKWYRGLGRVHKLQHKYRIHCKKCATVHSVGQTVQQSTEENVKSGEIAKGVVSWITKSGLFHRKKTQKQTSYYHRQKQIQHFCTHICLIYTKKGFCIICLHYLVCLTTAEGWIKNQIIWVIQLFH